MSVKSPASPCSNIPNQYSQMNDNICGLSRGGEYFTLNPKMSGRDSRRDSGREGIDSGRSRRESDNNSTDSDIDLDMDDGNIETNSEISTRTESTEPTLLDSKPIIKSSNSPSPIVSSSHLTPINSIVQSGTETENETTTTTTTTTTTIPNSLTPSTTPPLLSSSPSTTTITTTTLLKPFSKLHFPKKKHRPPELDFSQQSNHTFNPPLSATLSYLKTPITNLQHKRSADSLIKKFRSPSLPTNVLHSTPNVDLPSYIKAITSEELNELLLYYQLNDDDDNDVFDMLSSSPEFNGSSGIKIPFPNSNGSTATITPVSSRSHTPLSKSPNGHGHGHSPLSKSPLSKSPLSGSHMERADSISSMNSQNDHHTRPHLRVNNDSESTTTTSTTTTATTSHLPSPPQSKSKSLEDSLFIIDTRPSTYFNTSRIIHSTSICVPSTLLKRPNYTLTRFAECMAPDQRIKLTKLSSYSHIIVYDQSSPDLNSTSASTLIYTLLKLSRANEITGRICYLQGGISEFEENYPQLIDSCPPNVPTDSFSKSIKIANNPFENGPPTASSISSMPLTATSTQPIPPPIHRSTTLSLPPVLTGFCLPQECKEIGGSKSGFMALDNYSYIDDSISINLPDRDDLNKKVPYFPEWLKPITSSGGSILLARKFNEIEENEKTRLRIALSRDRAFSTPSTIDSEGNIQYSISCGLKYTYKNRYNNIWPYDHSRVLLPNTCSCDYINACYITSEWATKRYIATQAPLEDTVCDFWSVIFNEKVPVIVMLTAEYEGGQLKCHPYWKDNTFANLKLTKTEKKMVQLENSETFVIIRKFNIQDIKTQINHQVVQIHYTDWPDLGIPASANDLIGLCQLKEKYVEEYKTTNPTLTQSMKKEPMSLVHCSAGCGRTGTFCTVDSIIEILHKQKYQPKLNKTPLPFNTDEDIIYKVVNEFRTQRKAMVQSLRQYALCYESAILWCYREV